MENFLNVSKWWPNIKIFKLQINYRSRPHIVEAGNAIIANNKKQYKKEIRANRDGKDFIRVLVWNNDLEEAEGIVNLIKNLKEKQNLNW
jgi:DNA helicase-2/ATP-dependent DNA helicase PcrA